MSKSQNARRLQGSSGTLQYRYEHLNHSIIKKIKSFIAEILRVLSEDKLELISRANRTPSYTCHQVTVNFIG